MRAAIPGSEQDPPRPVVQQVFQVFAQRMAFGMYGLHPLACPAVRTEEKCDRYRRQYGRGRLPARLRVAAPAEPSHQRFDGQQCQDAAAEGEDHPVGGECRAGLGVVGDDSQQRSVGDVDERVDHHHHSVGNIGVDQLPGHPEARSSESQYARHAEGDGEPQQVGPEFPPAALCPVGQYPDDRIDERVPETGDEEHRADGRGREPEDVRVEEEQVGTEKFPEHRGSGIAEPVADLFAEFDLCIHTVCAFIV